MQVRRTDSTGVEGGCLWPGHHQTLTIPSKPMPPQLTLFQLCSLPVALFLRACSKYILANSQHQCVPCFIRILEGTGLQA